MSNIEGGRVSVNLRLLMRIANLFACRLDDIISGDFNTEGEAAAGAVPEEGYSADEVRLLLKMLQLQKTNSWLRSSSCEDIKTLKQNQKKRR